MKWTREMPSVDGLYLVFDIERGELVDPLVKRFHILAGGQVLREQDSVFYPWSGRTPNRYLGPLPALPEVR